MIVVPQSFSLAICAQITLMVFQKKYRVNKLDVIQKLEIDVNRNWEFSWYYP